MCSRDHDLFYKKKQKALEMNYQSSTTEPFKVKVKNLNKSLMEHQIIKILSNKCKFYILS